MDDLFRVLWGWYQPTQLYFTISLASQAFFFYDLCRWCHRQGLLRTRTKAWCSSCNNCDGDEVKQAFLLYILVVWDFALYKYKEKRQKWLLVAAMILLFFFISWNNNCLFDFSWIKMGTGFFFNSRAIYYWPR